MECRVKLFHKTTCRRIWSYQVKLGHETSQTLQTEVSGNITPQNFADLHFSKIYCERWYTAGGIRISGGTHILSKGNHTLAQREHTNLV